MERNTCFFFILLYFCLFPDYLYPQGEWNNWYFGRHAGITFNSGIPVPLTNCIPSYWSDMSTLTVSDSLGNLLFYGGNSTDERVYNRNNVLMPNGILINGTYFMPWCLLLASERENIPVVLHYHGVLLKEVQNWGKRQRKIFLDMERCFDKNNIFYIFPSKITKSVVEKEIEIAKKYVREFSGGSEFYPNSFIIKGAFKNSSEDYNDDNQVPFTTDDKINRMFINKLQVDTGSGSGLVVVLKVM